MDQCAAEVEKGVFLTVWMLEQSEMRAVSVTGLAEWEWVGCGGGGGHSWFRLRSQSLLWCLMEVGTSECLKRTVLLCSGMSRWLNVLSICHSSSWSGWEGLFRTVFIMSIIFLLRHCLQTVQFQPDHRAGLLTKFTGITSLNASSLTHDSQEQRTCCCWLLACFFTGTFCNGLIQSNFLFVWTTRHLCEATVSTSPI